MKSSCPTCGKLLSTQHLQRQIQECHATKRTVLMCPACDHEETPIRVDLMTRHITRMHPGVRQEPARVSVPPYRTFRYCLVPGCRYRSAWQAQMARHTRARHPAWQGETTAPQQSAPSLTARPPVTPQTTPSTSQAGSPPRAATPGTPTTTPVKAEAAMVQKTAPPSQVVSKKPTAPTRKVQEPPTQAVASIQGPVVRPHTTEVSFAARDVRFFAGDGTRRRVPLQGLRAEDGPPTASGSDAASPNIEIEAPTIRPEPEWRKAMRDPKDPKYYQDPVMAKPGPTAAIAEVFEVGSGKRWMGTLHLQRAPVRGPHRLRSMSIAAELCATFYPA